MMEFERFLEEAQREAQQRVSVSVHPTEELLWAYASGVLAERARWQVGAHLGSCLECTQKVKEFRRQLEELDGLLQAHLPEPSQPTPRPWAERLRLWSLREEFERMMRPRPVLVHALAYAVGSLALFGLNALLNHFFAPSASPIGSPAPPSWWASYAVGAWGGLVLVHGLLVLWWKKRNR